ncbi:protein kinase [Streptomyces sp. NPDC001185]|uniref:protein kinase domain-containing protein n=1 Tax=Streptomyces sp. NPDC001185 TaxID=3154380 RepID=UPI00331D5D0F
MYPLLETDPTATGRYRLLGRLGSGGMGSVYLGRTPGGRPVAVKVINSHLQHDPMALARFRREVETLRAVRNPYTAALVDAEVTSPPYWMATEYVPGPTLAEAVAASGPLPDDLGRAILAALAEGLADIHAHGVLHRDIKPQNVILSATGPQLIDFGIARSDAGANLTQAGVAIGTPGFIAPETLTSGETGPPADVFALGVTVACSLTGRPPYGEGSLMTLAYRTVHEAPDLGGIPAATAELIAACTSRDPAARPVPQRIVELCASATDLVRHPGYRLITAGHVSEPQPAAPADPRQAARTVPSAPPPTVLSAPSTPPPTVLSAPSTPPPTVLSAPSASPGVRPYSQPPETPAGLASAQTAFVPPPTEIGQGHPHLSTEPGRSRRRVLLGAGSALLAAVVAVTGLSIRDKGSHRATPTHRHTGAHASAAARSLPQTLTVRAPRTLRPGESLRAAHVTLTLRTDGDLVSLDTKGRVTWRTGTSGTDFRASFQADGNLVVQDATGKTVWASNTGSAPGAELVLRSDGNVVITQQGKILFRTLPDPSLPPSLTVSAPRTLKTGEYLQSAHAKLIIQKDGNLVVYDERNQPRWASHTSGQGNSLAFQQDGNLVVYRADGRAVWASNTGSSPGAHLELRADGDVVVSAGDRDLWHTSTAH